MSNAEMIETYQKAGGDVCGRFREDQLGARQADLQEVPSRSLMSQLQKFALALLVAFGLASFSAKAQNSQEAPIVFRDGDLVQMEPDQAHTGIVRGKVKGGRRASIYVVLEDDKGQKWNAILQSGRKFEFTGLQSGTYSIRAKEVFGRQSDLMQVKLKDCEAVVQKLKLGKAYVNRIVGRTMML